MSCHHVKHDDANPSACIIFSGAVYHDMCVLRLLRAQLPALRLPSVPLPPAIRRAILTCPVANGAVARKRKKKGHQRREQGSSCPHAGTPCPVGRGIPGLLGSLATIITVYRLAGRARGSVVPRAVAPCSWRLACRSRPPPRRARRSETTREEWTPVDPLVLPHNLFLAGTSNWWWGPGTSPGKVLSRSRLRFTVAVSPSKPTPCWALAPWLLAAAMRAPMRSFAKPGYPPRRGASLTLPPAHVVWYEWPCSHGACGVSLHGGWHGQHGTHACETPAGRATSTPCTRSARWIPPRRYPNGRACLVDGPGPRTK